MADLRGKKLSGYTLTERIGRGGMSDVYRAVADSGSVEVAVKVLTLDPEQEESAIFLARFEREAKIITELHHDHILPILDYGQEDNLVYFVTPLITGGTLAELIRRGALEPDAACHWLRQIASALDHAHKMHVIHRDLKPSNVLLDEDGHAYLMDFGIAKLTTYTSGLTQTGNVIGTPAYMAPEQWRDEKLDARTDVYGLGIMTYLMLTTHTPFSAETPHAMMYQHLDEQPPALRQFNPEIPETLEHVVLKALAKFPQRRYKSAGEFAADFCDAAMGKPTLASQDLTPMHVPVDFPPPVYSPYRRYPMPQKIEKSVSSRRALFGLSGFLIVLIVVVTAVLAAVGGQFFQGQSEDESAPTFTPSPVVTPDQRPIDVPRIRVDNPQQSVTLKLGESITINVMAFDREGVTRIEMRRFGEILEEITSEGERQMAAQFVYTPDSVGQHRLELIAFRGNLPGDPRFITISVDGE